MRVQGNAATKISAARREYGLRLQAACGRHVLVGRGPGRQGIMNAIVIIEESAKGIEVATMVDRSGCRKVTRDEILE